MDASRARQRLGRLAQEVPALVAVAQARSPLWRGQVRTLRRKCGKPTCRCARGELHAVTVLSDRSGEESRSLPLTEKKQLLLFTEMTEDYRSVRQARARLVKVAAEMLTLFDQLEESRRKEAVRRHGGKLPPPRDPQKPP